MNNPSFNIAAVERDTGLSKDVLRMWERRYGFPVPGRDSNGERSYPPEQVERLRLIKRLMDAGHRPGKLIATPAEELSMLAPRRIAPGTAMRNADASGELDELLALIKQHDGSAYLQAMQVNLLKTVVDQMVEDNRSDAQRRREAADGLRQPRPRGDGRRAEADLRRGAGPRLRAEGRRRALARQAASGGRRSGPRRPWRRCRTATC